MRRPVPTLSSNGRTATLLSRMFAAVLAFSLASPCVAVASHAPHATPGLRGATNGRPQGYLGIEFHDAPEESLKALRGSTHGVEVIMVDHDGPAGKAGLRPHDIIVSMSGQAIAGSEALRRMIHDAGAGVQVALTVVRSGHLLHLSALLADREEVARAAMAHLLSNSPSSPAEADAAPAVPGAMGFAARGSSASANAANLPQPTEPATPPPGSGFLGHIVHGGIYTGAVLEVMEPQLAGFFGAPQGAGLLVHSVQPNSPAANAGLRAGDVVLRADLYTMRTQADWAKRLHSAKGRPIPLHVLRDKRELSLTLQQDTKRHSMLEWPALMH